MKSNSEKISIIVPCYNEQEALPFFYEEIIRVFSEMEYEYEVLFINDGSKDDTLKLLQEFASKNENIKYKSAGENIAKWHDTPEFVMERWMQSKGHRDNILNKNYNEIGIGKAVDKNGKNYWVQIFIEKKK